MNGTVRMLMFVRRWTVRAILLAAIALIAFGVMLRHQSSVLVGSPPGTSSTPSVATNGMTNDAVISTGAEVGVGIDVPPGTVALTFDDGPDPEFTELILATLDKHDVRATFFLIGERALAHPEIAQAIVAAGHEVGNHSHLHFEMGQLSARQVEVQLDLADLALVETTGTSSRLYRAPYSGGVTNLSADELAAAQTALGRGYYLVASDISPRDYDMTMTAEQLILDATPPSGTGAVITLHDGGGDRWTTVEMLGPLIEKLQASGYEFKTVGELVVDATGVAPVRPASQWLDLRASVFAATLMVTELIEIVAIVGAVAYVTLYVIRMFGLILLGLLSRNRQRLDDLDTVSTLVSVIVPAYNEEVGISAALKSIDANTYPNFEIIVVDDGSTDGTAEVARSLGIDRVRVLSIANGGKAGALNQGINEATGDILVMVDGDTLLEPDTIEKIVKPFADPRVGAVAGNPKIGNAESFLTRLQASEYLIVSSLERRLLSGVDMITTIPGAIGAWRRAALQGAGHVSAQTLAEDTDLTVAIARGGWKVSYVPDARAWTEAPSTWRLFYRQRLRWTFGTLQVLWKHRGSYRDRGDGSQVGRIAIPYMFVSGYVLGALGPLVDLVLLVNIYLGNWRLASVSWAIMAVLAATAGVVAARLDGEPAAPALLIPLQQFVYRPIMHAITFASLRRAALGERQTWGAQERVGGLTTGEVNA